MANIIAIVWDFDKTLIDGYMQNPIFEEYGVDARTFWNESNALPQKYLEEQGVKVNKDTIYLNHFIKYTEEGKFKGLNNQKLFEFGAKQKFYSGVPKIFEQTIKIVEDPKYKEYDIRVEHYIISTGMSQIIRGTSVMKYITEVWGCELIEGADKDGILIIKEIGYTIDNTSKTRALFEINKGVCGKEPVVSDVNTRIPEEFRRVHFKNMIYIADGPSDIPAFSVVNQFGGCTFAIYPKGNKEALKQVEEMREDGRINMYAEADYSEGTTANMWICNKIREFADRIREEERSRLTSMAGKSTPRHLI